MRGIRPADRAGAAEASISRIRIKPAAGNRASKAAASRFRLIAAAVGQDWIFMLPRPRRAAQPVPGLRFSVEALGPPEMAPAELPVLFAPSKRSPTAAQQRRIVAADDRRPAPTLLGQAVALEWAARLAWKKRPCF